MSAASPAPPAPPDPPAALDDRHRVVFSFPADESFWRELRTAAALYPGATRAPHYLAECAGSRESVVINRDFLVSFTRGWEEQNPHVVKRLKYSYDRKGMIVEELPGRDFWGIPKPPAAQPSAADTRGANSSGTAANKSEVGVDGSASTLATSFVAHPDEFDPAAGDGGVSPAVTDPRRWNPYLSRADAGNGLGYTHGSPYGGYRTAPPDPRNVTIHAPPSYNAGAWGRYVADCEAMHRPWQGLHTGGQGGSTAWGAGYGPPAPPRDAAAQRLHPHAPQAGYVAFGSGNGSGVGGGDDDGAGGGYQGGLQPQQQRLPSRPASVLNPARGSTVHSGGLSPRANRKRVNVAAGDASALANDYIRVDPPSPAGDVLAVPSPRASAPATPATAPVLAGSDDDLARRLTALEEQAARVRLEASSIRSGR